MRRRLYYEYNPALSEVPFHSFTLEFLENGDEEILRKFLFNALCNEEQYKKYVEWFDAEDKDDLESYEGYRKEFNASYGAEYFKLVQSLNVFDPSNRLKSVSSPLSYDLNGHKLSGYFESKQIAYDEDTIKLSFKQHFTGEAIDNLLTRREAEELATLSVVAFQYHLREKHIYPAKESGSGKAKIQLFWKDDVLELKRQYVK